ncbi:hypothetical protein [Bradyrhizobium diazoefficiens]
MSEIEKRSDDLFFEALLRPLVEENPRFLRRDWLANQLDARLADPRVRFVLLTAEPGAGKSAFLAQLAYDHPDWLRYFIRRDQTAVMADVSQKSVLLRTGFQLAAVRPELFASEELRLSVLQNIGEVATQGQLIGAEIERLTASPFYHRVIEIEQHVRRNAGSVLGLKVRDFVVDSRLLTAADLLDLALIHPARALARVDPDELIVILIDALDEIRYHAEAENILAWLTNCPDLPANIRFVLTSRPSDSALDLFRSKQASALAELAINEHDIYVLEDVRSFVENLVIEPAFAKALKGETKQFARKAVDKAQGNLGYLDALARGIDQAIAHHDSQTLQTLLNLEELPRHLEGLYAFFLRQIREAAEGQKVVGRDSLGKIYSAEVWPAVYDPILGVLAVAAEPLSAEQIAALGDIVVELKWVYPALNRLRQFFDVIDERHRLYHATVAEFLTSDRTRRNKETADLYQDATLHHNQIADYYWRLRDNWAQSDDYGLANLAFHLLQAKQFDRLELLISPDWMSARVSRESFRYSGFVSDLASAWKCAYEKAIRQVGDEDPEFSAFATCFRYALIRTSINALSDNYPPSLIRRAVELGLWSVERALGAVAYSSRAADLYLMLLDLDADKLTTRQRNDVQYAALTAALEIDQGERRAKALTILAPRFFGEAQSTVVEEALDAILRLGGLQGAPDTAPHLSSTQVDVPATMAGQNDPEQIAKLLTALTPYLGNAQRSQVIDLARTMEPEELRAQVWAEQAPYLSSAQLDEALETVREMKSDESRSRLLSSIAPFLKSVSRLDQALAIARVMKSGKHRVCVLKALAPSSSRTQLDEMIATTRQIESPSHRVDELSVLAPYLNDAQREEGVDAAWKMGGSDGAMALAAFAPYLNGSQVRAMFTAVMSMKPYSGVADILDKIQPNIPAEHDFSNMIFSWLRGAEVRAFESFRTQVLQVLCSRLDEAQLDAVMTLAKSMKDDGFRVDLIGAVTQRLTGEARTKALATYPVAAQRKEASKTTVTINFLPGRLEVRGEIGSRPSGDEPSSGSPEEELASARSIKNARIRAEALVKLAMQSGEERLALLSEAVSASQNTDCLSEVAPALNREELDHVLDLVRSIGYEFELAESLAALAPLLSGEARTEALHQALAAARSVRDEPRSAKVLAVIATQLADEAKVEVLSEVFDCACTIEDEWWRFSALEVMAPHINDSQIEKFFVELNTIEFEQHRVKLLAGIAAQTKGARLDEAIVAARALQNGRLRVEALAVFTSQLNGESRISLLNEALREARRIEQEDERAMALTTVASHLNAGEARAVLGEALAAARATKDPGGRARGMSALVPRLSDIAKPGVVEEVLEILQTIEDRKVQEDVLCKLAPGMNEKQFGEALETLRSSEPKGYRLNVLLTMAEQLSGDRFDHVVAVARSAATDKFDEFLVETIARSPRGHALTRELAIGSLSQRMQGNICSEVFKTLKVITEPTVTGSALVGPETVAAIARNVIELKRQWRLL